MPKHLFLCRHAESYGAAPGQKDLDRQLTPAGVLAARQAGTFIKSFNNPLDLILCSPSTRTRQSAALMAAEKAHNPNLILINDLLYDAPARTFLHELQNLDPRLTAALVVGHNPSVTEVVNLLTGLQNSYIPAGGCTYITFEASDWHLIEWSDIKYMINYT